MRNVFLAIAIIIGSICVVYYNSLNTPFIFDEIHKIVENPDIKHLDNILGRLVYPYNENLHSSRRNDPSRPLVYLTFALNYHFSGLNTRGYHIFNLCLHILNSLLIFFLSRKMVLYAFKKEENVFPFLAALLFAVHPVNTEVVTYIYHRSESLSLFFVLLSLLCFIKTAEGKRAFYVLSLLSFILALSAKQPSSVLPALVLAFDYIFVSGFSFSKVLERKKYHLGLWLILIAYLAFRRFYFGGIGDMETDAYFKWTNASYFVTELYVIIRYILLLLAPAGLCVYHLIGPASVSGLKLLASSASLALIIILLYRVSAKRTALSKLITFSALWFFIALAPTSSFMPIADAMADRRLYLSGFGFYSILASIYFLTRDKTLLKQGFLAAFAVYVLILGIITVDRNKVYRDPILLWQDQLRSYPDNPFAYNNMGLLYSQRKDFENTIKAYQKALAIDPLHFETLNNLGLIYKEQKEYAKAREELEKALAINPNSADTRNNLGTIYHKQGEFDKAIAEYSRVLSLDPGLSEAHNNLAVLYQDRKEYSKAEEEFRKALEINPNLAGLHNNLGDLYLEQNMYNRAVEEFGKALKLDPGYTDAMVNLGMARFRQGEYSGAAAEYRRALGSGNINDYTGRKLETLYEHVRKYDKSVPGPVKPAAKTADNAMEHYNLALLCHREKKYAEALEQFRKALEIGSTRPEIHYDLAILYDDMGRHSEAIGEYQKVVQLKPDHSDAHNNLGVLYYNRKNYDKAVEEYNRSISINPGNINARNNLGALYYFTKQYDKALAEFRALAALKPGDRNVRAIIDDINKKLKY